MQIKRETHAKHINSIFHLHAARIKTLLKVPCMSYAEIGRRVGISRERVSQIVKRLPNDAEITANYKQTLCSLERSRNRVEEAKAHGLLGIVVKECEARGLPYELVSRQHPMANGEFYFSKRFLTINGNRCYLSKLFKHKSGFIGLSRVGPASDDADFIIYCAENIKPWLIIPRDLAPITHSTQISLTPDPNGKGKAGDNRHDWPLYFDNWDLLR